MFDWPGNGFKSKIRPKKEFTDGFWVQKNYSVAMRAVFMGERAELPPPLVLRGLRSIYIEEYIENSFAIAFDLTADSCFNTHLHSSKDCVIDIKLKFESALAQPLSVLYICSYQNKISVSPDKNVYLDYTV